ncbi:MAG: response regulator [Pseudomonadales bacterium]
MARVLIVDDSPTETQKLKAILTRNGHEVFEASSGEAGIEAARVGVPDVVLMDIVMPGMNGFQATRQIKKDASTGHIPVVIVTTKNQATDRIWGERQGASGYLVKPVEEKLLLKTISEVLG